MNRAPDLARIERLLALVAGSGVEPLVVLTSGDRVADPYTAAQRVAGLLGVTVYLVSRSTGAGVSVLRSHVRLGRTLGLLGARGSGRSNIVTALVGGAAADLRRPSAAGRAPHATSTLVPVPGGGAVLIISTPPPEGDENCHPPRIELAAECARHETRRARRNKTHR